MSYVKKYLWFLPSYMYENIVHKGTYKHTNISTHTYVQKKRIIDQETCENFLLKKGTEF